MQLKKPVIWGCGIALLVFLAGIAAVVLFLVYVAQDPKGVSVSVDGPTDVVVGQSFRLNVTIRNERSGEALALSDIDIAEEYLEGFTVATIEPAPKSSMHVPIDNSRSFTFGVSIPPMAEKDFSFTLRAEKPGIYRGDVDVCEGLRFITGMAQTVVEEKQ